MNFIKLFPEFNISASMESSVITNENIIEHIKGHGPDATTKYMVNKYPTQVTYKSLLRQLTCIYQKYQHLNKSKTRVKGK